MNHSSAQRRWEQEIKELQALQSQTGGKFCFEPTIGGLRLSLHCRSPVARPPEEPRIEEWEHVIDLIRPPDWPARPVILVHKSPRNVLHPNIFYPLGEERIPPLVRELARGYICYADRHTPLKRLRDLVEQVYDMLGYRFRRYSRHLADCLSPAAVRWVNGVLAESPELLPTERRPFMERPPNTEGAGK